MNKIKGKIRIYKTNEIIIYLLMIFTTIMYGLFTMFTINTYQISNFINTGFLNINKIVDTSAVDNIVTKFSSLQDGIIILGVLPELIIILLLLFMLTRFERNNKKTINSNLIHIIMSGIFLYFIHINVYGSGVLQNLLSRIYYYNLINISLYILYAFLVYYIIYKIIKIISLIKNKETQGVLKNYKIFYYPFLVIAFIILILNIFSSLTISYIAGQILSTISLSTMFVFTNIFQIPLDVNLSQILPDLIVNFFSLLNIPLDFTLNSIGVTDKLINTVFNNLVLNRADMFLDNFILDKINGFLFVNIYNVVICLIVVVACAVSEYIEKDKYYYSFISSVIGLIFSFNINTLPFNILKIGFMLSVLLFVYLIIAKNKERNKEVFLNTKRKYKELKKLIKS